MSMVHVFDEITPDALREAGWKKWTEFGTATGAWIAEMDFGTAPAVQETLRRAAEGAGLGYLSSAALRAMQEAFAGFVGDRYGRSEEHTSELQSRENLVCRLLLEKKKK